MSKKVKYIILLVAMIFINLVTYIYCVSHGFEFAGVNHVFQAIIFLEVAVYSTLILFEVSKEDKR